MPALPALTGQPVPILSCPWAAWYCLSSFISSAQSWSSVTLVLVLAALVSMAMASRRPRWSWHSPAAAPPPSIVETKSDLGSNWRQSILAQSSSAQAPVTSLPVPTIRRSSYPPAGGGKVVFNVRSRPKERILTESDFDIRRTRRDTIEEFHGCRRHTMVVGGLHDTEPHPHL